MKKSISEDPFERLLDRVLVYRPKKAAERLTPVERKGRKVANPSPKGRQRTAG